MVIKINCTLFILSFKRRKIFVSPFEWLHPPSGAYSAFCDLFFMEDFHLLYIPLFQLDGSWTKLVVLALWMGAKVSDFVGWSFFVLAWRGRQTFFTNKAADRFALLRLQLLAFAWLSLLELCLRREVCLLDLKGPSCPHLALNHYQKLIQRCFYYLFVLAPKGMNCASKTLAD